jgi:hypothetical protein
VIAYDEVAIERTIKGENLRLTDEDKHELIRRCALGQCEKRVVYRATHWNNAKINEKMAEALLAIAAEEKRQFA